VIAVSIDLSAACFLRCTFAVWFPRASRRIFDGVFIGIRVKQIVSFTVFIRIGVRAKRVVLCA